jgi:hypothetical protein
LTHRRVPTEDRTSCPASIEELPLLLTPQQLAVLLKCSERTLERERENGRGVPFTKQGRRIYYLRDVVIAAMRKRMYTSTAEAKRAASEAG